MSEMYVGSGYKDSNPTWHAEDAPWKARQVAGILQGNQVAFSTMAEVGCGTGEILVQLSRQFTDVTYYGYDIAPDALEIARTRTKPGVSFYLEDPLADESKNFDVVLVADVIEHVEDCFAFMRNVKRLGTFKVFHIPLDLSVQSVMRMWPIMNLRQGVGHIHYFTKDTALALLEDCGYKILDTRYTASRLELPNQALTSKMAAAPRRLLHRINADLAVRMLGGYSLLVLAE